MHVPLGRPLSCRAWPCGVRGFVSRDSSRRLVYNTKHARAAGRGGGLRLVGAGAGVQTGFGGNVVTYRKLFHLLIGNCFITSGLLIEITVRRVPKFTISVLGGDLVILMILTMRRTTWTTLQGLRATGFPITRGRSLAPTPASGSSALPPTVTESS